jgi:hypothetical protein
MAAFVIHSREPQTGRSSGPQAREKPAITLVLVSQHKFLDSESRAPYSRPSMISGLTGRHILVTFRFRPLRILSLHLAGLLAFSLFLSSCAGKEPQFAQPITDPAPTGTTGPNAILNGSGGLYAPTTNWFSAQCHIQLYITGGGGFYSIVHDTAGRTSSGPENWTQLGTENEILIGPGAGIGGFLWIEELQDIVGSTASGIFTANVVVNSDATSQSLGNCTFTLLQGSLP